MRHVLASLFLLSLMGCRASPPSSINRIEISLSGWSGMYVTVNKSGGGKYDLETVQGKRTSGTFVISPEQFGQLVGRLEPFRREAIPFTEASASRLLLRKCPKGLPFTTDQGAFWVRWIGHTTDQQYFADLGCDADRNARRNTELRSLVNSLPVPRTRNANGSFPPAADVSQQSKASSRTG